MPDGEVTDASTPYRSSVETTASAMFVSGPAKATHSMSQRGFLSCAEVDRNRFCVAKQKSGIGEDQHKRQNNRAERIDVLKWIEREPPGIFCRIVAEMQRNISMRRLMQRDGENDRNDKQRDLGENSR